MYAERGGKEISKTTTKNERPSPIDTHTHTHTYEKIVDSISVGKFSWCFWFTSYKHVRSIYFQSWQERLATRGIYCQNSEPWSSRRRLLS